MSWLQRSEALIGPQAIEFLSRQTVAVLGLGGVGGSCAEALCRAGIGRLILIDSDTFDETNLNRQVLATRPVIGKEKVTVAKERFLSIAPECEIQTICDFYLPDNREILFAHPIDFVADAIDTVSAKLDLMEECFRRNIPLISCMGTGNRLDPSRFRVGDIADTAGCGDNLAKVIRRELKKRSVPKQTVVYSLEPPQKIGYIGDAEHGKHSPASISFTPPAAGYLMASYIIRTLLKTLSVGSKS
jgi:tRNA A37 threonylcarbamoyladenosine dehydratase